MQRSAGKLVFSPSDLIKFMESEYIAWMDRFDLEQPGIAERDPESETDKILQARGIAHEAEHLAQLRAAGREIIDISTSKDRFAATIAAMQSGADIIYQGALRDTGSDYARGFSDASRSPSVDPCDAGEAWPRPYKFPHSFLGYADFLERVPGASTLGDYHYEPWDTKLALNEKPHFLIQLSCYADLLALIQGVIPKRVHVVLGDKRVRSFRTDDYIYYYRQMRKAFVEQQANFDADTPPDFIGLEDFGRWNTHAKNLMETQDHLCRVANIRTVQFKKLHDAGIATMTDLATSSLTSIPKMKQETFATLKQQARLQIESRGLSQPKFEVINPQLAGFGLTLLPAASALDVYFDMEGFPLMEGGKSLLEYLLQDQQVVSDDFGIFLGKTWRMHPDVCSFISGAVYEDRLHPEAHTAERTLKLPEGETSSILRSAGLIFVPVMHEGNNQDSEEESAAIVDIVKNLRNCQFIDGQKSRKIELNDILLVAPYNMQVRRLRATIPGCRAGSVDKFQGQEAPVVIVSMCSSTGDSSSRGLEFIFSKNRLNVAISRAQVLAIVVGSPALSKTHCNHVAQMELVNLFCRIQAGFDRH